MIVIRWPKRDASLRILYKNSEVSKLVIKSLLASSLFSLEDKIFFFKRLQKYSFKSSISFYNRSCLFTGHSRSVFRLFKLSRHQAKYCASSGILTGLRKSSF
jgi:succinate dehydrogenase (ubiquinone) iron-sulfur subunit